MEGGHLAASVAYERFQSLSGSAFGIRQAHSGVRALSVVVPVLAVTTDAVGGVQDFTVRFLHLFTVCERDAQPPSSSNALPQTAHTQKALAQTANWPLK